MKKIFIIFLSVVVFLLPLNSVKAETLNLAESAKSAILLEVSTGEIIFEKNAHEKLAPASMTKIMGMLLVIESIEKGIIKWDEMVTVSERASGMGGSQILLSTGEKMSVRDLFKGVAIASGNDAIVALAEKIAGTEDLFVSMMNKRAKELGLKNTNFKNSHGLDEANHYSTAYYMAMMAKELVKHEKVLEFTSIYEDYLRADTDEKVWLVNTNKLVRFYDGVDGLKTGYTNNAGYCLTATAKRNNMRVIAVVMGEPDSKTRNSEVTEMLDYAFAQYEIEQLLSKNSIIGQKEVEKGKDKYVELVPVQDVTVLNRKMDGKKNATYELEIDKLKAPLKKGDIVGRLKIIENEKETRTIDVTVNKDVKKANILELYWRYLKDILAGDIRL
jgi:D-alanyl-D-alanine carboxypeptidase (penicillin-binding protein 5/6)